jgi:ParB-like chromosome segregation protein Spo0J
MKIEMWNIEKVKEYEKNVKIHDKAQVSGIAESIKKFGWDQPIVVDTAGVIIKGHGRRQAALSLGMKKVPVLVRDDLTPAQVRAARLADNRVALGGIDTELMKLELAELSELTSGDTESLLKGIFTDKEMSFLEQDLGDMSNDPLIDDLDAAVETQEAEAKAAADASLERQVPLAKVFGFSTIPGAGEFAVTHFMVKAEHETAMKGAAAFVEYVRRLTA